MLLAPCIIDRGCIANLAPSSVKDALCANAKYVPAATVPIMPTKRARSEDNCMLLCGYWSASSVQNLEFKIIEFPYGLMVGASCWSAVFALQSVAEARNDWPSYRGWGTLEFAGGTYSRIAMFV